MRRKVIGVLSALVVAVSLVLVVAQSAGVVAASNGQTFTESGTFTVPETVIRIMVEAWGGGGAGGGSTSAGGGSARGGAGGGGGAYASSMLTVQPGQELQVVVGAGGTGTSGADGNPGAPSFAGPDANPDNAVVRAAGGSGGSGNTGGGTPAGGTGGTAEASLGDAKIAGDDGGDGATGKGCSSGAGGNGANGGGLGGAAVTGGSADGNVGSAPGAGGGGARTNANGGLYAGGAGARGEVVITWITYDLNISSAEGGSVVTPGEGVFTCGEGAAIGIVAAPATGYQFDRWTGDVGTIADIHAVETTVVMNGDYSITANYEETPLVQYDVDISSGEGGSVATPGEGVFTYDEGTIVDLMAAASGSYRFHRWTGDVGTIANVYGAATTVTMNGHYYITAEFVKQYDLTVSETEGGSVTVPGEGVFTYDEGAVVDLVASPGEGYRFVEWTGDVTTIGDVYGAATNIIMTTSCAITAQFEDVSAPPVHPTVSTQIATGITTSSATLNMNYSVGDFSPVQVRFAYKECADLVWSYTAWVSKSATGTCASSLSGLASDTQYDFKAQLSYSDPMIEVEGAILEFTTGTPPPYGTGGGCFIATAAYGTPTAEQIDVLREFRDGVLLRNTVGSQLVNLYYQLSPPIADFIARNRFLRALTREVLLDPIVWVVEGMASVWRN